MGFSVGDVDGPRVASEIVGAGVGDTDGSWDGVAVTAMGVVVGKRVGALVGAAVVGLAVGLLLGLAVGDGVGDEDGSAVTAVGTLLGNLVGAIDGNCVGETVCCVGVAVGACVMLILPQLGNSKMPPVSFREPVADAFCLMSNPLKHMLVTPNARQSMHVSMKAPAGIQSLPSGLPVSAINLKGDAGMVTLFSAALIAPLRICPAALSEMAS